MEAKGVNQRGFSFRLTGYFLGLFLVLLLASSGYCEDTIFFPLDEPELNESTVNNTTNVSAEWTVDFTASPFEGYPPLCVQFNVAGPNGEYAWDFGNNVKSNVMNPVHCYRERGSYWVKLKYWYGTIAGEVSKPDFIKVLDPAMYVDFTADPPTGEAPLTTRFSIIGNPTHIRWNFGDGSDGSSDTSPVHQYADPGNYTPTLTYCLAGACDKLSKFNYIEVKEGNPVDFIAERESGVAPVCTRFVITGDVDYCSWDFGDGGVSYKKDPVHCYSDPGLYTVSLTYSIEGAHYTITKNQYLRYVARDRPDFTFTPNEGMAPLCVEYAIVNPSQSWKFHFGDNSSATGAQTKYCYGKNGTYFPSLEYCTNNLCDVVESPVPIRVYQPRIIAAPGDQAGEMTFTTDAPPGLSYSWDFGDGLGATGATVTHRYDSAGTYRVSLVVSSLCGCNSVTTREVTVQPKGKLDFSGTPVSGCAKHCVQFSEQSPEIPLSRLWEFGDGDTSEEKNPFHCYLFPGKYTVSLKNQYTDREEHEMKEDYVTVHAVPKASFSMFPSSGYAPLTVRLTDATFDAALKRYWDFGDGSYSSDKTVDHRFIEPGDYNVTLMVWGDGECRGEAAQTVHVMKQEETPYDLTGLPRRGVAPLCVSYQVTGQIQQATVNFGDGTSSHERNPFYCYDTAGIYSPSLTACDADQGCEEISKPDFIVASSPQFLNLTLLSGWNLVSVPVTLETGADTMELFMGVDTAGHSIYAWDNSAGSWIRMGKDDRITPLSAFWVYTRDPMQIPLRMAMDSPAENPSVPLNPGWNLVSFGDIMIVSADEAFRSVQEFWSYTIGYDAMRQRYAAPVTKGFDSAQAEMDPRQGYWLFMNSSAVLVGKKL